MKKLFLLICITCSCLKTLKAGRNKKRTENQALNQQALTLSAVQSEPERIMTPQQETPKSPTPRASANFWADQQEEPSRQASEHCDSQEDFFADVLSQTSQHSLSEKDFLPQERSELTDQAMHSQASCESTTSKHKTLHHKKTPSKRTQFCFFESDEDDMYSDPEQKLQYQQATSMLEQLKTTAHKKVRLFIKSELDILLEHDNSSTTESLFESFNNDTEQISNFVFNVSNQALKRQNLSEIVTAARFIKLFGLKEHITPKQASDFQTALSASHEIIKLITLFENPAHSDPTKSPRAISAEKYLQTLAGQYDNKLSTQQIYVLMNILNKQATSSQE